MKTKRTIRNCPLPIFRQECPRLWEELTPTADASVRHCGHCKQDVYLCSTDDETLSHARAGHCIARMIPDESELPVMYLGQPKHVPPTTLKQDEALRLTHRERGIDDALKNLKAPRSCPRCHYPAPSWRSSCRVCGLELGRASAGGGTDA
ncbi:MAG TPA: hypothetical protein VL282_00255 [Tepidisphaeraceae bacterium]|nr:hypothetical protein [Tepidisphaeraceae bacterium]